MNGCFARARQPIHRATVWDAGRFDGGVLWKAIESGNSTRDLISLGEITPGDGTGMRVEQLIYLPKMKGLPPVSFLDHPLFVVLRLPRVTQRQILLWCGGGAGSYMAVIGYTPSGGLCDMLYTSSSTGAPVVFEVPDGASIGPPMPLDVPIVLGIQYTHQPFSTPPTMRCTIVHPNGSVYHVDCTGGIRWKTTGRHPGAMPFEAEMGALWTNPDVQGTEESFSIPGDPLRRLVVHEIHAMLDVPQPLTDLEMRGVHATLCTKWGLPTSG